MPSSSPPAAAGPTLLPVRRVPALRPFSWLRQGWIDVTRTPWPSLLHGLLVAAGGLVLLAVSGGHWSLLSGAFSGFVLVAPILATGLYELSRLTARGERPGLADVVTAWRRGTRPLVWLGALLFAAGTLWVLVSAGLFALFVKTPITDPRSFLRYAAAAQGDFLFMLWLILGGLGAAIVFAATAVSPPLLLGRVIDLKSALLTSVRAVGENPVAMVIWASVIMLATAASMATLMAGFVVAIPVLGHASWHAYRDLVDTSSLPLRY
jgi:uncharacterized membrane protein